MKCQDCLHWLRRRSTVYTNGEEYASYEAPPGKGMCRLFNREEAADFGCVKFAQGSLSDQMEVFMHIGAPWETWEMIDCPDCGGKGDGGRGHRCAGTGKVRKYGDGFIGDENTRRHPKQPPEPAPDMQARILAALPKRDPFSTEKQ